MAEAWASLLGRLRRAYKAAGLDCGDKLRPPARPEAVRKLARRVGVPVPPSLRAVWHVHGGQGKITWGNTGLFGRHRLLSPAEAAEKHRMWCEVYNGESPRPGPFPPPDGVTHQYFHPQLVPFASWDKYDLCVDTASGEVWDFSTWGTTGGTGRPSLRALVRELLALLAAGRPPEPDFIFPRPPAVSRWRTADVMSLARSIAANRATHRLRTLADALKAAGCDNEEVLTACRRRSRVPDGWWVIDLLLSEA